jgi:cysteinyl-tRNA synthetase
MMVLNASYRSPLTFNDEVVAQAERNLERLRSSLRPARPAGGSISDSASQTLDRQMEITQQGFIEAMDDDFNTAGALGHLFDLVRTINQVRDDGLDQEKLSPAQDLVRELAEEVFGLRLERAEIIDAQAAPFIDLLIEMRNQLRDQKLWALSDMVRDRLLELGILVEDTKDGTSWRWK